jgi:dienelactone hydrolase
LGLQTESGRPALAGPQKAGEIQLGSLAIEKYLLTSEDGIVVPTRVILPKSHSAKLPALVYLRDRNGEGGDASLFADLASQGWVVAVADVRGFGETMSARHIPDPHVDYFDPRDGMDSDFAIASFFLGRPLLGMRVRDAGAVVSFLRARPDVDPAHLIIAGKGWAGVVALFTAALDPEIAGVAVEGTPVSYAAIAAAHLYNQPISLMLPGVLKEFDLADVLASLAPRPLIMLNPQDAMARKMNAEDARQSVDIIRQSYSRSGAENKFEIEVVPFESETNSVLMKWISKR